MQRGEIGDLSQSAIEMAWNPRRSLQPSRTWCLDIIFAPWKTTWASFGRRKCCPCDTKIKQLSLHSGAYISTELAKYVTVQSRKLESKLGMASSTFTKPLVVVNLQHRHNSYPKINSPWLVGNSSPDQRRWRWRIWVKEINEERYKNTKGLNK